jgi:MFS family permease
MPAHPARAQVIAAFLAFATFGTFWGVWGASIPRLRTQAGLEDAQLGLALLFVGAGALPAMLLTGKAIDRWGLRLATPAIMSLGAAGVVVALAGQDLVSLSVALTLVGVTSGASDVANNTVAGRAERAAGRPVITRAHGVFSLFVVLASLGTGLSTGIGAPVVIPFAVVAVTGLITAALIFRTLPAPCPTAGACTFEVGAGAILDPGRSGQPIGPRARTVPTTSLLGFGLLGALAFASENAHQSWSAIFVTDALGNDVALSTLAPAVFAAAVATTRFATGGIGPAHARVVLAGGSGAAAVGALIVSGAPNLLLGLMGLIVAAAGTAVLFPTILSVVSGQVHESRRGRATSTVTTVAYLGFLLGPVYVGFWAGAVGIRGAMVAVAALGALLLLTTPIVRPAPPRTTVPNHAAFHSSP